LNWQEKSKVWLVLEGIFGQGSRSWNSSIEDSIRRKNLVGFPLILERFWPWLIAYILCSLSYCSLCFGSCLMKKTLIINEGKKKLIKWSKNTPQTIIKQEKSSCVVAMRFLNLITLHIKLHVTLTNDLT